MCTRDVIPIVRDVFGIENVKNHWAQKNVDLAASFFREDLLDIKALIDFGYI